MLASVRRERINLLKDTSERRTLLGSVYALVPVDLGLNHRPADLRRSSTSSKPTYKNAINNVRSNPAGSRKHSSSHAPPKS